MSRNYLKIDFNNASTSIAQLAQLTSLTADGDLISKPTRDMLFRLGYVTWVNGWNIITPDGIIKLERNKVLHQ